MSERYIPRSVHDDNFAHTLMLLGPCISWARELSEGYRLSFNDVNMMQVPVECVEALVRSLAEFPKHPAARACKEAVKQIDLFQKYTQSSRKPPRQKRAAP